MLRRMVEAAIEMNPKIPVCLHQDHGNDAGTCLSAIQNGFSSVMMDGSLEAIGFRTAQASDGREALAKARELRPDVILMDLSLPGIDGWAVTRRLKRDPRTRRAAILALTAHAFCGEEERAPGAKGELHQGSFRGSADTRPEESSGGTTARPSASTIVSTRRSKPPAGSRT